VFYGWRSYPGCALFNGVGGPDDHTATAAAPFRMSAKAQCPVDTEQCYGAAVAFGKTQCCQMTSPHPPHKAEECMMHVGCKGP